MKFKSVSGGHVRIFLPWRPNPLDVDGEYETSDKQEIDALKGSSEVITVKEEAQDRPKEKREVKSEPEAPKAEESKAEAPKEKAQPQQESRPPLRSKEAKNTRSK